MSDTDYMLGAGLIQSEVPEEVASSPAPTSVTPLWAIKDEDDKILSWHRRARAILKPQTMRVAETMLNNFMLYKGVHFQSQDGAGDFRDTEGRKRSFTSNKMVMNEMFDYTQEVVAEAARQTSNIAVVPPTREHHDRDGAKVTKQVIDTIEYTNNFEQKKRDLTRWANVFGGQPLLTIWDEWKGDIHKDWFTARGSKATSKGTKRVKVSIPNKFHEGGKHEFLFDPERPLRQGDPHLPLPLPWQVFYDPKFYDEDKQWFWYERWMHVEEVVWEFAWKDKTTEKKIRDMVVKGIDFNIDSGEMQDAENQVFVTSIYGRSSKYSRFGREIHIVGGGDDTSGLVLRKSESKYPRQETVPLGNLPIEILKDLDIPGDDYGFSSYQILAPLNHTLNQTYSAAKRNLLNAGNPMILIPNQAQIKKEMIGNTLSVVRYRHPYAPQVLAPQVIGQEAFAFINQISTKMLQLQRRDPNFVGELGPNVRSGRQIALLEEIRQARSAERKKKWDEFNVRVKRKLKSMVGKYYKDDENRLINVVGKNRTPIIASFRASQLSKPYDFRIVSASGLPDLPQQRLATVVEMFQIPEIRALYPTEAWAAMFEFGDPGKFSDAITSAADKAEWENEEFTNGKVPPLRIDGDDDLVHVRIHYTTVRSRDFLTFSDAQQEEMITHLMVHERKLFEMASRNPVLQQALMLLLFPTYFKPSPQLLSVPTAGGTAQTQGITPPPTAQPANGAFNQGALETVQ